MSGGACYDPRFFESLPALEDKHFWFVARNRVLAGIMARLVRGRPSGFRILEIGCGTGNTLRVLETLAPKETVIGMDLFAEGLRVARSRVRCPLLQADMRHPPFSLPFGLIGMFDVLEHLDQDIEALAEAGELLAPDGRLILTVPAHPGLWSCSDEAARHRRRYTRQSLSTALQQAGLEEVLITYYMAAVLPPLWLSRRVAGRVSPGGAAMSAAREFRIVPGLNGFLTWALRWEAAWLAGGRRVPFGSSLLAVAGKRR